MQDQQVTKNNARLAISATFIRNLSFTLPIWLIYSLYHLHLTTTVATALFMTIWIGSAIFEVPTGALADRLGRKKIFIIGSLLLAFYPIAYRTTAAVIL